eukprot:1161922_1
MGPCKKCKCVLGNGYIPCTRHMFLYIVSIFVLNIQVVMSSQINCTTANRCSAPIQCSPDEPCLVNCFGTSGDSLYTPDACHDTTIHCTNNQQCTINCLLGRACRQLTVYCPNNHICDVNAPYDEESRLLTWANIYGGYNGTLNVLNNAHWGYESGYILCPPYGDCHLYSMNPLNVTSPVESTFGDATINATLSNLLNITIHGIKHALRSATIYCPTHITSTAHNCIVNVSDGPITMPMWMYINENSDLYINGKSTLCIRTESCVRLYLDCPEYKQRCDLVQVDGTYDQWQCMNQSIQTQCPMTDTTTVIETTDLIPIANETHRVVDNKHTTTILSVDISSTDLLDIIAGNKTGTPTFLVVSIIIAVAVAVCFCCVVAMVCLMCGKKKHDALEGKGECEILHLDAQVGEDAYGDIGECPIAPILKIGESTMSQFETINADPFNPNLKQDKGAQCANCSGMITDGKAFVSNGVLYCDICSGKDHAIYTPGKKKNDLQLPGDSDTVALVSATNNESKKESSYSLILLDLLGEYQL